MLLSKNKSIYLSLITACFVLVGCKSTETSLSTTRMDRPEISSKPLDARLNVGAGQRSVIDLTDDTLQFFYTNQFNSDSTTFSISPEPVGADTAPFAKLSLSVAPRFEVSYGAHDDNKIALKYQFYGDTADKATAGNYSQALSLGFARYKDDAKGLSMTKYSTVDEEGRIISLESFKDFEQDTYTVDLAWIHGYRVNDNFLLYGGPYFIYGVLSGEQINTYDTVDVEENGAVTTGTAQANIDLDSNGNMLGLSVAGEYEFDFGLFLTLEFSAARIEWEGASATETNSALAIGYHF